MAYMKPKAGPSVAAPIQIKRGSVTVKIYTEVNRVSGISYDQFTVVYYDGTREKIVRRTRRWFHGGPLAVRPQLGRRDQPCAEGREPPTARAARRGKGKGRAGNFARFSGFFRQWTGIGEWFRGMIRRGRGMFGVALEFRDRSHSPRPSSAGRGSHVGRSSANGNAGFT